MARVTIEDCLKKESNPFKLIERAAQRARELTEKGASPLVPVRNDSAPVIALREIAQGLLDATDMFQGDASAFIAPVDAESNQADSVGGLEDLTD